MLSYKLKNVANNELVGWYADRSTCRLRPGEVTVMSDDKMSDIIWGWINAKKPYLIILEVIKPVEIKAEQPKAEEVKPETKKATTAESKAVKK